MSGWLLRKLPSEFCRCAWRENGYVLMQRRFVPTQRYIEVNDHLCRTVAEMI